MKDAKGHGSEKRGVHASKLNSIGRLTLHPNVISTLKQGDGSVKPGTGTSPKTGYMVSIPGHTQIVDAHAFNDKLISQYADRNAEALRHPDAHIGKWQDTESGKIYLDVSHNIKSKIRAISAGKKNNQIAIWDLNRGKEIRTGGDGTS